MTADRTYEQTKAWLIDQLRRREVAETKVEELEARNGALNRQVAELKKRPTRAEHAKLQADYYRLLEQNQKLQHDRAYG